MFHVCLAFFCSYSPERQPTTIDPPKRPIPPTKRPQRHSAFKSLSSDIFTVRKKPIKQIRKSSKPKQVKLPKGILALNPECVFKPVTPAAITPHNSVKRVSSKASRRLPNKQSTHVEKKSIRGGYNSSSSSTVSNMAWQGRAFPAWGDSDVISLSGSTKGDGGMGRINKNRAKGQRGVATFGF